ncbi:Lin1244/Lin1753 domain-containing protein [Paenibacillus typhae]|uniref:Lin1244/Lin1753 domain-containing protein n=1 Tax=Paenibacillus typhae TaxID=1174501 RepID=UPI001C8DB902|nr:Lin1244/Lin1753 domain-containing protein [Paenibacillus typhae]MBY0011471.1 DUF4373 domain-containing protein [Paenibacillus typhae]
MARPIKEGLDYFPLDIDFDQDDKLVVPVNKFGMQGLGIIVKLMSEIYRTGYFYPWGEREQYVFGNRINVDVNTINEVVNECLRWGFFHDTVYQKYHVLTSKGFQKRYIEASKRRKMTTFTREYVLIDLQEAAKVCSPIHEVDVNGNRVNVYINPDKVSNTSAESTQSKVKESKVNEIEREKEIKPQDEPAVLPIANPFRMFEAEGFGTISSVISDQLNDFITDFSEKWVCEAMKASVIAGKRNLSYVRAILNRWKSEGIDEPWTKEKPAAPPGGYTSGRSGGRSNKQHIEITQPDLSPPTPEQIAEHEALMAKAAAIRDAKLQGGNREAIHR